MNVPTVIDFFCGAGGFSEGFKQQGFEIIAGYDNWRPAIDTFNYNFGEGKGIHRNILAFENDLDLIEALPNTSVILGSPPCVSFSSSNHSGKADKSLGIRLTKTFLKIVAIKKHRPKSTLQAWFMENVVQSIDHIAKDYSFRDLDLSDWAKRNKIDPRSIAIALADNHASMNAADYGAPQQRVRAVAGELISTGRLVIPALQCTPLKSNSRLRPYTTLRKIREMLPSPYEKIKSVRIVDPIYPIIQLPMSELSDQFYDTGLYASEWRNSEFQKINHPYMGKMSFPENESKPSRTITATRIGTSREAIIYRSEYRREGDGEYRTPTVRESATLMTFPITYQFLGSESTKCRLVGNAVCPVVSAALASTVRNQLRLRKVKMPFVEKSILSNSFPNLNTSQLKTFDSPPIKKVGARFRRHPFKDGNITVTLSNYDIEKVKNNSKPFRTNKWITSVQYGNGNGFPNRRYRDGYYKELEPIIKTFEKGPDFLRIINNGFSEKIANRTLLQEIHERQASIGNFPTPIELISEIRSLIESISFEDPVFHQLDQKFFLKSVVPKKQVLALYAINKICSVSNAAKKNTEMK